MLLVIGQEDDLRAFAIRQIAVGEFDRGFAEGVDKSLTQLGRSLAGREMKVFA